MSLEELSRLSAVSRAGAHENMKLALVRHAQHLQGVCACRNAHKDFAHANREGTHGIQLA